MNSQQFVNVFATKLYSLNVPLMKPTYNQFVESFAHQISQQPNLLEVQTYIEVDI